MSKLFSVFLLNILLFLHPIQIHAGQKQIHVDSVTALTEALARVSPGTKISIAPGFYSQGFSITNVHGTFEQPIIISGRDSKNPPLFTGIGEGAKLSKCSYVKLSNLVFRSFPKNGINIDDGGSINDPAHHIVLENIMIHDIGPKGNCDALKLTGVDHFIVRDCYIENWGGAGIDMVGCHHGVIEGCQLRTAQGFRSAGGVQIKGGSRSVLIQRSVFRDAGTRGINLGGQTGLNYFRPVSVDYEAKDVVLAGNTFIGAEAPVAWVTAQDSYVHHNLFFMPQKWVGRILQESKDSRFKPCQKGFFEKNVIVADTRVDEFFNVGSGTDPRSFAFSGNVWFRLGNDEKPDLPTREKDGIYDLDPMIIDNGVDPLVPRSADPRIRQVGPWAYVPWEIVHDFLDVTIPKIVVPAAEVPSWWDMFFK